VAPSAFLSPANAARRLGVSAKALRLYEERGLLTPGRTAAGWRAYGSSDMERAAGIVALRGLGLNLAQIGHVLDGKLEGLDAALATHQSTLEARIGDVSAAIARVRDLRGRIATGSVDVLADLTRLQSSVVSSGIAFDLPWPWGGERFEMPALRPLLWLTGPLFSGKTRLAETLADVIPGAAFIGLDRKLAGTPSQARMDATMQWLVEDGATESGALLALLAALEAEGPDALIFDLIEQGLDEATQLALAACLRRRGAGARPIIAMTRSSAMLDMASTGPDEMILYCPANHSPPILVAPHPGAPGYESVASCLAPPDVRARSEGIIAVRQPAA
jgi:DNA-binding transcriptional MerR regulator